MASSVVIKVKHVETVRRFTASVDETRKLDIDMDRLRKKIVSLFSFLPDADFTLNYIDEDGEVIALVDEDDFHDIMKQSLNPLRITVELNRSSTSNPIKPLLHLSPNLNADVYRMLKSVPGYFYEALSILPLDFPRTALVSAMAEIVRCFAKMRGTYMNPLPKSLGDTKSTSLGGTSGSGSGNNESISYALQKLTKMCAKINKKSLPSTFPDQDNKEVQNSKDLKRVAALPLKSDTSSIYFQGGYKCANHLCSYCGVQIVCGPEYKKCSDFVCRRCYLVEMRKITGHPSTRAIPWDCPNSSYMLNRIRLEEINSALVGDFSSIADGTVLAPSTTFTKIWRMRNNGTDSWPKGTKFRMVEGDRIGDPSIVSLLSVPVGVEIDIVLNFIAPKLPGQYVSFWYMTTFGIPFGQYATLFIQVAPPLKNDESSSVGSGVSSASRSSDLGCGKKDARASEEVELERDDTTINEYNEMCSKIRHRKVFPLAFHDQESKEIQNSKELEPVRTSASGTHLENTCFDKDRNPSTSKLGANGTPDVGPAKKIEDRGGYQCARCWVHIVSAPQFEIVGDSVCKMCFEVKNRNIRGLQCLPTRQNRVRVRKINSSLIGDLSSISDGTVLAPSTPFKKIWRMRNNGSDSWPKGSKFVMIDGDRFCDADSVFLQIPENGLLVGSEIDISVDFTAPELPGQYVSFWQVTAFGIPIGQPVVAFIQVAAPLKDNDESINSPGMDSNVCAASELDDQTVHAHTNDKNQALSGVESPDLTETLRRRLEKSQINSYDNNQEDHDMPTLIKLAKEAIIRRRLEAKEYAL